MDQNEPVGNQKLAGTLLPKLLSLAELSISIGNLSVVKYTRELILKTNLAKFYHNSLLTLQMTVAVSHPLVQGHLLWLGLCLQWAVFPWQISGVPGTVQKTS